MSGWTFAAVDKSTGREFSFRLLGDSRAAMEQRLFDMGFALANAIHWNGWDTDPAFVSSKAHMVSRFDELRAAGNIHESLKSSLERWVSPQEMSALRELAAQDRRSAAEPLEVDVGAVRMNITLDSTCRLKTFDHNTSQLRWMSSEEEEAFIRESMLSTQSLGEPSGAVFEALTGLGQPRRTTWTQLLRLSWTECTPCQRFWLIAALVAGFSRRSKRDPSARRQCESWGWQLLSEFPRLPGRLDLHPGAVKFRPTTPINALAATLTASGAPERAAQVLKLKHSLRER